jgi:hypothetical protein
VPWTSHEARPCCQSVNEDRERCPACPASHREPGQRPQARHASRIESTEEDQETARSRRLLREPPMTGAAPHLARRRAAASRGSQRSVQGLLGSAGREVLANSAGKTWRRTSHSLIVAGLSMFPLSPLVECSLRSRIGRCFGCDSLLRARRCDKRTPTRGRRPSGRPPRAEHVHLGAGRRCQCPLAPGRQRLLGIERSPGRVGGNCPAARLALFGKVAMDPGREDVAKLALPPPLPPWSKALVFVDRYSKCRERKVFGPRVPDLLMQSVTDLCKHRWS